MNKIKIIGPVQYSEQDLLGSGSTGNVFKGVLKLSNVNLRNPNTLTITESSQSSSQIKVAIKVIPHSYRYQNQVTSYLFNCQKLCLKQIHHENVIKCLGIYEDSNNSYIITELIQGVTLKDYLLENKILKQSEAIQLLKKLIQALIKISTQGFVHRDIKPANIMISRNTHNSSKWQKTYRIHPVIIDFGFAEHQHLLEKPNIFYNVGSPSYMSPQSYNATQYTQKSDLWSIAVVFFQVLTGQPLDMNLKIQDYFKFTQMLVDHKINSKFDMLGEKSVKILNYLLKQNVYQRPSALEAINFINKTLMNQNLYRVYQNISKRQNSDFQTYQSERSQNYKSERSINYESERSFNYEYKQTQQNFNQNSFNRIKTFRSSGQLGQYKNVENNKNLTFSIQFLPIGERRQIKKIKSQKFLTFNSQPILNSTLEQRKQNNIAKIILKPNTPIQSNSVIGLNSLIGPNSVIGQNLCQKKIQPSSKLFRQIPSYQTKITFTSRN